ncbi:uncharacterized protein LOC113776338 [Coffea eugenioides]|uniref:uncharacterized protein LOC113776338 n=1 Tax=Coffea eugenioides TaxID=49369 RepID=UPI000F6129D0|nr:uncharacterized protein LOC113776338 [Coffea eugenioides]
MGGDGRLGLGDESPMDSGGDFNVIASSDEREGGAPANAHNMEEFNTSMFTCGLSALAFDGSRFTWTNGTLHEIVASTWETQVQGIGMGKFFKKLSAVRKALRRWNWEVFGNVTSNVQQTEQVLRQRQRDYDRRQDEESRTLLHKARALFNKVLAQECAFWHQKAGVGWLQEGDANTAYFHSLVRQRRNVNFISWIRMDEGG